MPFILVLNVSLCSFDGTEPPSPSDSNTLFGRYLYGTQILLCGRRFPTLRMENELNRNLTVRNDRFAILPSKIRSSPKSPSATSLNSDVIFNIFLGARRVTFILTNHLV